MAVATACAPAQKVMIYHPGESAETVARAWPAPDRTPRLEYAGELIGERNFVALDGSEGRGRQFLRWIAGLGRSRGDEASARAAQRHSVRHRCSTSAGGASSRRT